MMFSIELVPRADLQNTCQAEVTLMTAADSGVQAGLGANRERVSARRGDRK